ncbi:MAG: alpha/beta hydrolase [Eubacterium sp.]|nr:alpha/beta hydrolase [Eubacterium sp.]
MNTEIETRKTGVLILFGTLVMIMAILVSCSLKKDGGQKEVSFFIDNDRGSYDLVELSVPAGEGPYPVVLMAHGFAGSLHSGGAVELGKRLASRGVMAVRIDFDPYAEPDRSAERTDIYTLSQMNADAVKVLDKVTSEYGGDPDNVSLYGRSYGGRLMMQMANESSGGYDYRKLALVAPAGDKVAFRRYLGGDEQYEKMKKQASGKDGFAVKLGVKIVPEWFEDVETYDPCEFGWKFGDKPVLLFYNTRDKVVYPDTSIRCAEAYKNHRTVKVTTDDGHGYEMGWKKSDLKDRIMDELVEFLAG